MDDSKHVAANKSLAGITVERWLSLPRDDVERVNSAPHHYPLPTTRQTDEEAQMTEELATLIAEARLAGVHPVWLRIISGQQVGFLHGDPSDLRDMLRNQLNRNELHENWRSPPTFHKD